MEGFLNNSTYSPTKLSNILGSPYAIDIKASDVGLQPVKVWGPGIENGIIPDFQSTFWVETTGAGAGDLRVRIMGPKGQSSLPFNGLRVASPRITGCSQILSELVRQSVNQLQINQTINLSFSWVFNNSFLE